MSDDRRIYFTGGREWAAHAQDHWLDFAGNPNIPDYLRIVFVAYGRHAPNGHAKLDRGELAHFLVRKDGTLPGRGIVRPSIQKAIQLGYLDAGSQALCLVVSSDHAQKAAGGDPNARCPRDHTKRSGGPRPLSRDQHGRFPKDGVDTCPSQTKDGAGHRPSAVEDGAEHRPPTLNPSSRSRSTTGPEDRSHQNVHAIRNPRPSDQPREAS